MAKDAQLSNLLRERERGEMAVSYVSHFAAPIYPYSQTNRPLGFFISALPSPFRVRGELSCFLRSF